MRIPWFAGAALLIILALPASTAGTFMATVGASDPLIDRPLTAIAGGGLGYIDGNTNGHPDAVDPDEPVYLDVDLSHTVNYGDVRLTPFLDHPAGSLVGLPDRDFGRPLIAPNGGIATAAAGIPFVDMDNSGTISPGDVRLGDASGSKVAAGDADVGTALTPVSPFGGDNRIAYVDSNQDRVHQSAEALFVDRDGNGAGAGRVSAGDLRLTTLGFGAEGAASSGATPASDLGGTPPSAAASQGWRTVDYVLVGLCIVNLAGLVIVYRASTAERRPRSPFK
jgi:hypothetical protein